MLWVKYSFGVTRYRDYICVCTHAPSKRSSGKVLFIHLFSFPILPRSQSSTKSSPPSHLCLLDPKPLFIYSAVTLDGEEWGWPSLRDTVLTDGNILRGRIREERREGFELGRVRVLRWAFERAQSLLKVCVVAHTYILMSLAWASCPWVR